MQSVTLECSPSFNVGKAHGLDSLRIHTTFPTVPNVGEEIQISAYEMEEGQKPQNLGDYYTFVVKARKYYWETPSNQPEVSVRVELKISDVARPEYESDVCNVLLQVYGWKPIG